MAMIAMSRPSRQPPHTTGPGRFSFNVKGGRCEECQGEGVIDAALLHAGRRGHLRRVQRRPLQQRDPRSHRPRQTIDDVLDMSVEEGVAFFATEPALARKIAVLTTSASAMRRAVQAALQRVATEEDRGALARRLKRGRVVYQSDPAGSALTERILPDSTRTLGRLVNRRFVPARPARSHGR